MADGAELTFHKVAALPLGPLADAMYFVRPATPGARARLIVTSATGEAVDLEIPGETVQLAFGSGGIPPAGGEFGRYLVNEDMDIAELLSLAVAQVAATAQADVLVSVGATTVARFRWAVGATVAAVTALVPTVNRGDLLILTAPAVQDATLAGITGTFALLRRIG